MVFFQKLYVFMQIKIINLSSLRNSKLQSWSYNILRDRNWPIDKLRLELQVHDYFNKKLIICPYKR